MWPADNIWSQCRSCGIGLRFAAWLYVFTTNGEFTPNMKPYFVTLWLAQVMRVLQNLPVLFQTRTSVSLGESQRWRAFMTIASGKYFTGFQIYILVYGAFGNIMFPFLIPPSKGRHSQRGQLDLFGLLDKVKVCAAIQRCETKLVFRCIIS